MNAKNYAGIAWPGIFLVLTGTYAYWASQRELVSSRPSTPGQHDVADPVPTPGLRTVHSRMWEDPLSTAYRNWKSLDTSELKTGLWTISDGSMGHLAGMSKDTNQDDTGSTWIKQLRDQMKDHYRDLVDSQPTVCLPVFVQGGPYAEDKENRMRTRYAVVTALAESGYYLKSSKRMSYLVANIYVRVLRGWQEREIVVPVKLYANDQTGKWVLVLWINESELGLRPLLATHRILNEVFSDVTNPQNFDLSIIGPMSSETLKNMAAEVSNINLDPPKSPDTLKEMAAKGRKDYLLTTNGNWTIARYLPFRDTEPVKIDGFCPLLNRNLNGQGTKENVANAETIAANAETNGANAQASAADTETTPANAETNAANVVRNGANVQASAADTETNESNAETNTENAKTNAAIVEANLQGTGTNKVVSIFSPRATMDGISFPHNAYFNLYRVIGTDGELAKSLEQELRLRGVFPGNVVLITEHDTAYGRKIFETLKDAFNLADGDETVAENETTVAENETTVAEGETTVAEGETTVAEGETTVAEGETTNNYAGRLYTFRILRGIDGILPGDPKELPQSSAGESGSFDPAEIVQRPPEGRSQYDYLERLPGRIRAKLPKGGDIAAIGVVGSDVYDKLLVLRALKPKFPDCLFFTTDLHAIYTHPNERQHARNLIVASHFGLALGNKLQQQTPPFRDSYQTAEFLATRLAIATGKENQAKNLIIEAERMANATEDYFVKAQADTIRSKAAAIQRTGSAEELRHAIDDIMIAANRIKEVPDESVKPSEDLGRIVKNITDEAKVIKDVTEIEKHWEMWDKILSKLDRRNRGESEPGAGEQDDSSLAEAQQNDQFIKPMIHVIGRDQPHQLTTFDESSIEAELHPAPARGISGWHVIFVAVVTFVAICGVLLLPLRDRFRISLLLGRGRDYFESAWIEDEEVQSWRTSLNTSFLALLAVGLFLAVGLVINALSGNDVASPLGGYTTWTRNILYAFAGMAAVVSIAYLVDRLIVMLNEAKQDGGKVCERAWETFQMTQVLKGAVLAVVFAQIGVLFVCGFNSFTTLCLSMVGFAVLACAAWHYRKPPTESRTDVALDEGQTSHTAENDDLKSGLMFHPSPRGTIWLAMGLMFAITGIAALVGMLEGPAPGWQPSSMSRGGITRTFDWLTRAYAFGMVGVLLFSLLYCLSWCIEFSRYAKQQVSGDFPSPDEAGLQIESEQDRLWLVGKLTSVTGGLAPAVMGLLLVLAVAYHPVISPTSMPMGLLAVITIALGLFVGPMLFVRWHFDSDRQQVLVELQKQLSAPPRAGGDRPQRSTDSQASALNPLEGDRGESELVPVLPSGESIATESEEQRRRVVQQPEFEKTLPFAAVPAHEDRKQQLEACKQQIEVLSDGVFKPWAQSPIGWILGGGASLALIDLWLRWWTLGV